jgi:hypothetical protein
MYNPLYVSSILLAVCGEAGRQSFNRGWAVLATQLTKSLMVYASRASPPPPFFPRVQCYKVAIEAMLLPVTIPPQARTSLPIPPPTGRPIPQPPVLPPKASLTYYPSPHATASPQQPHPGSGSTLRQHCCVLQTRSELADIVWSGYYCTCCDGDGDFYTWSVFLSIDGVVGG